MPTDLRSGRRARGGAPRWVSATRVLAGLACVGLLAVAAVLMLADRAPGALRSISDRIDQSERRAARVAAEAPIPHSDFVVHVAVWAAVTTAAGLAAWSWRRLAVVGLAAFALSTALELAQPHLTRNRRAELGDVLGNITGIVAGAAIVACCYVAATAAGAGPQRRA